MNRGSHNASCCRSYGRLQLPLAERIGDKTVTIRDGRFPWI